MEEAYEFELEMRVRDYECDIEGIVNNAVYLNYLEYARHEFLRSRGIEFAALHADGTDAVVIHVELDYLRPLTGGEQFVVKLRCRQQGRLRTLFQQDIYLLPEGRPVLRGVVHTAFLRNGRPVPPPPEVEEAIFRRAPEPDSPP